MSVDAARRNGGLDSRYGRAVKATMPSLFLCCVYSGATNRVPDDTIASALLSFYSLLSHDQDLKSALGLHTKNNLPNGTT